jgi:hypothetical protein
LEARLRGRGTENEESLQKRLENAMDEMKYGQGEGNFDMYLVNDNLYEAAAELCATVKTWFPFLQQVEEIHDKELQSVKEDSKIVDDSLCTHQDDMPDDEANDEISEAKTEVVDNTEDAVSDEVNVSCNNISEAIAETAIASHEEFPEDETEEDCPIVESEAPMIDFTNDTNQSKINEVNSEYYVKNDTLIERDSIQKTPVVVEGEAEGEKTEVFSHDANQSVIETLSEYGRDDCKTKFYSLQELKIPIVGVDWASREDYLSDEDIAKYFGMTRNELKALPKWKRQAAKKKLGIF